MCKYLDVFILFCLSFYTFLTIRNKKSKKKTGTTEAVPAQNTNNIYSNMQKKAPSRAYKNFFLTINTTPPMPSSHSMMLAKWSRICCHHESCAGTSFSTSTG